MSGHSGETHFRGMTESDWKRLHTRVIPNPVPLEEFKEVVLTGKLQDRYLAKDLHKVMQELRDLLREHGELREAAIFPLSGKKQELSQAAAAAVRVIDAHRDCLPALRRSPGSVAAPPDVVVAPEARDGSNSPTLDSVSDQPRRLSASGRGSGEQERTTGTLLHTSTTPSTTSRRSSRVLPLVDHIANEEQSLVLSMSTASSPLNNGLQPSAAARLREPAVARDGGVERRAREALSYLANSWTTNERLSSTIAQHAAAAAPSTAVRSADSQLEAAPPQHGVAGTGSVPTLCSLPAIASTIAPTTTTPAPGPSPAGTYTSVSVGAANELAQLNEAAPPFFRILNVARRFQLRFGSSPLKFEIPVQYADAVNNRRLRVYLIPLRHPNIPARWPTAKEIVIYVNEQCVMTPWKRSWPDRKQEVAKTYLPLDITYLLSRNMAAQRIQVDLFNKEYLSPVIISIVQPQTLEEVTESMLLSLLGCRSPAQVQQAFQSLMVQSNGEEASVPSPSLLQSNDAAVWRTYASVLDEDEDEDGLEADDPVITTKCPISQLPLAVPVRGRQCRHLQCVDLDSFLVSSYKGAYWNCALCDAEMRPKDVQIDTVLWRYLHACGSSDGYPMYLRLSARPSHSGKTTESKYYWHPSTRAGEDADLVSDGDESGSDGGANGSNDLRDARENGLPQLAASLPSTGHVLYTRSVSLPRDSSATPSPLSSNNASWASGTAVQRAERKRSREEGAVEPQGTADDPIEL